VNVQKIARVAARAMNADSDSKNVPRLVRTVAAWTAVRSQGGYDGDAKERPSCVNALNDHILRSRQDNFVRQFEQVGARRYKAYPDRCDDKDFEKVVHGRSLLSNRA
jgi:hypothetical protein